MTPMRTFAATTIVAGTYAAGGAVALCNLAIIAAVAAIVAVFLGYGRWWA